MSRQLRCPNCGGEHTLVNPGITMLVCDFCKTVVYWDADSVLRAGRPVDPARGRHPPLHARDGQAPGDATSRWSATSATTTAAASGTSGTSSSTTARWPGSARTSASSASSRRCTRRSRCRRCRRCAPARASPRGGRLHGPRDRHRHLRRRRGPAPLHHPARRALPLRRPGLARRHPLRHPRVRATAPAPTPSPARCSATSSCARRRGAALGRGQPRGQGDQVPELRRGPRQPAGREVKTAGLRVLRRADRPHRRRGAGDGRQPAERTALPLRDRPGAAASSASAIEVCGRLLYEDDEGYETREYLLFNPARATSGSPRSRATTC